jgi:hypothetical protein
MGGVSVVPLKLVGKKNPSFEVSSLEKITFGNREKDNMILQKLCDGIVNFDDLRSIN